VDRTEKSSKEAAVPAFGEAGSEAVALIVKVTAPTGSANGQLAVNALVTVGPSAASAAGSAGAAEPVPVNAPVVTATTQASAAAPRVAVRRVGRAAMTVLLFVLPGKRVWGRPANRPSPRWY
jgi:hypothetical protein